MPTGWPDSLRRLTVGVQQLRRSCRRRWPPYVVGLAQTLAVPGRRPTRRSSARAPYESGRAQLWPRGGSAGSRRWLHARAFWAPLPAWVRGSRCGWKHQCVVHQARPARAAESLAARKPFGLALDRSPDPRRLIVGALAGQPAAGGEAERRAPRPDKKGRCCQQGSHAYRDGRRGFRPAPGGHMPLWASRCGLDPTADPPVDLPGPPSLFSALSVGGRQWAAHPHASPHRCWGRSLPSSRIECSLEGFGCPSDAIAPSRAGPGRATRRRRAASTSLHSLARVAQSLWASRTTCLRDCSAHQGRMNCRCRCRWCLQRIPTFRPLRRRSWGLRFDHRPILCGQPGARAKRPSWPCAEAAASEWWWLAKYMQVLSPTFLAGLPTGCDQNILTMRFLPPSKGPAEPHGPGSAASS